MSPRRIFISDEAQIIDLAQRFTPSLLPAYFKWQAVWRADPQHGRGLLPPPTGDLPRRADGLFWDLLDPAAARVQAYLAATVRHRLQDALAGDE